MVVSRLIGRRFTQLVDSFRAQLWPVPTIGVVLAVVAGVGLPRQEATLHKWLPVAVASGLFDGGPSAARDVLAAVSASLITVTSLTFSLTVLTLQLGSTQYSPRLLRTFARDGFVQLTLAVFLSTFVYALTVLRTIHDDASDSGIFVPKFAVTVAYVMALISVICLVLFLAHLVREIRVEGVLRTVYIDALASVRTMFPQAESAAPGEPPSAPPSASRLCATSSGFLVRIKTQSVLSAAIAANAVVRLESMPGHWLVEGTTIGFAWSTKPGAELAGERLARLRERVDSAARTGPERIPVQDAGYGLRQLTDVAVKALSAGINDPTTAIHTLGYISSLLCDLAQRQLGPEILYDDDGVARVILRHPDFAELLDMAISQPRRYGAADPEVLSKLLRLLHEVAWWTSTAEQRSAIGDQLSRLQHTVSRQRFDTTEMEDLAQLGQRVEARLADGGQPRL
ncbi:MAG: DUF2254 domain-containing protein [Mycobacterium sp.]